MSPEIIVGVIESLWSSTFGMDIQTDYFLYIVNFINQFLPFIIVSSLSGMHNELNQWIIRMKRCFGRTIRIQPFLPKTVINR
ncbi:unnamed protein product [Adineta steineri]|uniref:Uncharacterized protein n=2 Tax=Adineta steineri TaxID=433720 RepID=A0A820EQH8_9BILA|nr:unnamed protein product [Adineta steineri]CAF4249874.1 unnamed protein product [Adineta steineri]